MVNKDTLESAPVAQLEVSPQLRLYGVFFLIAVLVYAYPLLTSYLHIDGEWTNHFKQTIGIGRWARSFIRLWLLPEPFLPYFTMLLSLAFIALAAQLLAALFQLNQFHSLLFAILYISFPQFAYQFYFLIQADVFALSQVFGVLTVLFWLHAKQVKPIFKLLFLSGAVGFYALSIGIYQTMVLFPPTVLLARMLLRNGSALVVRKDVIDIATFLLLAVISVIVYATVTAFLQWHYGVSSHNYLLRSIRPQVSVSEHLGVSLDHLSQVLEGRQAFGFRTFVLAVLSFAALFVRAFWLNRRDGYWYLTLAGLILFVPLLSVWLSKDLAPARTFVITNLSFAVLVLLLLRQFSSRLGLASAILLALIHTASITNLFYSDTLVRTADILMANRIKTSLMIRFPETNPTTTVVYFHGMPLPHPIERLRGSELFGQSFFAQDYGNYVRISQFFAKEGIAKFRIPTGRQVAYVIPLIGDVPLWPNPESIVSVGEVIVVKLGSGPGWLPFQWPVPE